MVGCLSKIIQEEEPVNEQDWLNKYFVHREGRTPEQIMYIATLMSKECGESIEVCFQALIELIGLTYKGKSIELAIKTYIEKRGHSVEFADGDLDRAGVDLIVDGKSFIQVKPDSFCKGYANQGLILDRLKIKKQQKKLNKRIWLMFYDSNEKSNFDPHPYKWEDVFYENGTRKISCFKFSKLA